MSSPPRRRPLRPDIRPAAAPPAAPPAAQMSGAETPLPRVRFAIAASLPTVGRRLLAWGLEVVVLTASIAIPFQLGRQVNDRVAAPQVDLTPPLQWVQTGTARALGLSPRSLPAQVTPLTNVFWSAALGLPLLLVAGHCYSLSRTGHSWPKRCLGLQVLALNGQMPGLRRTLLREAIGKWGAPLLLAYGVWQVSGAFPMVSLLVGFTAIALVGESLTSLGNRPRRAGHDWLAGTCVVDQETGAIIRLSSLWEAEAEAHGRGRAIAGPQAVVMPPRSDWSDPDLTLSKIGVGVGLLLTVGGLIGVGSYWWLERPLTRFANPDKTLYTHLVSTLTDPTLDPAARRAAVLALGNLPDDRVTPLLVDLIAQTDDVLWLDALQQALVTRGPEAFPYLRRLNQSLVADLAMQGEPTLHRTLLIRLQTVNRIVAKLLLLEGGGGDRSGS
ncbi:MAG TPA: RDD family protein, partial [Candidatus Obscuribacterales bacterium]